MIVGDLQGRRRFGATARPFLEIPGLTYPNIIHYEVWSAAGDLIDAEGYAFGKGKAVEAWMDTK